MDDLEIIDIIIQIVEALMYLHKNNIIHRNINPS
jgi:serine/threonine protein kinase